MAQHPINDARVYWEWAGDIAAGKLVLDHPFFSAPLYPYLLGGLRWLGGQLTSVYVLQMLADLAAVVLLGWTCRRRFGAGVALGARRALPAAAGAGLGHVARAGQFAAPCYW